MTLLLTTFSAQLRAETATVHAQAEGAPFLLALAEGRVTLEGVVGLLQRLVPVYDALEELGLSWAEDPEVAPLLVPGLERSSRLKGDLAALGHRGTGSVAARAYAARIRTAGVSAPAYVAHHYTRYLGDLSGGQVIAAALRRSLGLELSFLAFPDLRGPAVKRDYRAHLDSLPWTEQQRADAVAEAVVAFEHNRLLAAELTGEVL